MRNTDGVQDAPRFALGMIRKIRGIRDGENRDGIQDARIKAIEIAP
jgi:hypothetical protein